MTQVAPIAQREHWYKQETCRRAIEGLMAKQDNQWWRHWTGIGMRTEAAAALAGVEGPGIGMRTEEAAALVGVEGAGIGMRTEEAAALVGVEGLAVLVAVPAVGNTAAESPFTMYA